MRNVDYWKDEIIKLEGRIAVVNNVPCRCNTVKCSECAFQDCNCFHGFNKWLYEEHVEKPTLTIKERMLCEILENGYIARDSNDELYYYKVEPQKQNGYWYLEDYANLDSYWCLENFVQFAPFEFISHEDNKPWSIKDLLALEVKDDPVTT